MDRELQCTIAACRAAYSGATLCADKVKEIRWDRLLHLSDRHRVQALCWRGLGALQRNVPGEIAEAFAQRSRVILEANLRAAAECAELRIRFSSSGVRLLFVKGLALGALAYPEPMLKMGCDVDLLIDPNDLGTAADLLRDAGYKPVVPVSGDNQLLMRWHARHKESVWQGAKSGVTIDLHTRLADHPSLLPAVGINSPSRMVSVASGIDLPTLQKDELFAYLCVHGASSAWFRLKWVCDLAALLRNEPASEAARLYEHSQTLGAGRSADQALLVADELFGVPLEDEMRRQLQSKPASRWLTRLAITELRQFCEPTDRFLGTAGIHLSQLLLLPGLEFKLSETARQVGGAFRLAA